MTRVTLFYLSFETEQYIIWKKYRISFVKSVYVSIFDTLILSILHSFFLFVFVRHIFTPLPWGTKNTLYFQNLYLKIL